MVLVLVATQSDGIVAIAHSLVVGGGVEQRPDQVAQVVDIFIFRHQLCGQQDGVAVELVVPVSFDIAKFAGTVLPYYLNGSKNVGVGWGYTMYQTAKLMPMSNTHRMSPI